MDGFFDVLPPLAALLVVSGDALNHDGFQVLQPIRLNELHRLDSAVAVVVPAHLRIERAHGQNAGFWTELRAISLKNLSNSSLVMAAIAFALTAPC